MLTLIPQHSDSIKSIKSSSSSSSVASTSEESTNTRTVIDKQNRTELRPFRNSDQSQPIWQRTDWSSVRSWAITATRVTNLHREEFLRWNNSIKRHLLSSPNPLTFRGILLVTTPRVPNRPFPIARSQTRSRRLGDTSGDQQNLGDESLTLGKVPPFHTTGRHLIVD